ncbi:MAG: CusA/CzcA family heavy metal efflux RND transporter [Qipengyuania citrea]|uniref:Metal ion efflux RND protein family protein n=9 Tax=Alphaproteobacteria TaxID=28211 RepID=A0A160HUS1_9SPHN|nr:MULTISPECIES: CusA/CzcA family heavy metal efflux RND transporter [Erythrobacteraceae]KZX88214.1 cation transporter [Erythrobacter sp. HI0020]KZY13562.1 cation transporter [Erythrobacter sp. HI0038]KZY15575.1 cation transporter [Erythrobacter sp. HI0037]MAC30696.1 CusA/CzcA family heavy metal efflux RND transporter [Erythrobacter sp.]MBG76229.1 CusA/CzcA family heavy metal efflux RND transporter [Erythrobacteraceae bacterium]MBV02397.1 CusA/CzcA family heavy metal efflux RND transporter [C
MSSDEGSHRHGPIGVILDVAVRFRWAIIVLTVFAAIYGAFNLVRLPIDAVPDITNTQVQINTSAAALSPSQVETQVTFPIETGLAGIEGLEMTRSISRNGFSQVTAIFEEGTDLYFARQQVNERLAPIGASLPEGAEPTMGPISTGLGEVLMYTIEYEHPGGKGATTGGRTGWQSDGSFITERGDRLESEVAKAAYLRTVQDWVVAPLMRSIDGVAGVDSIGGFEKQFLVQPDPARLTGYGLSFDSLIDALEAANLAAGANFVDRADEALLVRVDARLGSIADIEEAVIATREGVPIRIGDVADVEIGGDLRTGAASLNGEEAVVGTVLMRAGENSRTVAAGAAERLEEVRASLPDGVVAEIVYNRSSLVDATISTVEKNLLEGALLVIAVLFLLLGNIRAAIITALVIPVSMLMAAVGMNRLGVSGNLMSLGALDFGLIVDGAVIIVENSVARLAARQHREGRLLTLGERLTETRLAAQEMIKPTVYGQAIIFLVFAPLLTFTGVEGKTFSPMAITMMLALASAFVLSLTFVPAMIAVLLNKKLTEKEVKPIRWAKERYGPAVRKVIARPWPMIGAGVGLFTVAVFVFGFLGSEFTPQLDERDIAVQSLRIPSTSLERSLAMQRRVEDRLEEFPQVDLVFSRTGTAEVASDPMPPNASDAYVILKPRDEWPDPDLPKDELVGEMESALGGLIGNLYEFSQPIELRFNELIAGVRGDVAVKLYGDDLTALTEAAGEVAGVLGGVEGAADVKVQQVTGFPTLDIAFDRPTIARYGLTVEEVAQSVAIALGGRPAGLVFEGDRRFDVVVRLEDATRDDFDQLGALPIVLENGVTVPLRTLADFQVVDGLAEVRREQGRRLVIVSANVRERDLGSFVEEAQERVSTGVDMPPASFIEWGGQYQNLQEAQARLTIVVPIAFALVLLLLFMALGGWVPALAVFSAIPMALAGGVFALALRGLPFSVSAAVGFIALSGVAVLNGLVMMTAIRQRLDSGMSLDEAIADGALARLRPVLMTALVASLGFVPMAIATGTGAEVQRPLATVVIGGLITATALTLFVLPAIARLVLDDGKEKRSWRQRWWDRLRRNVTPEERKELRDVT